MQGMTALALSGGVDALPHNGGKPCWGWPSISKCALGLCVTFTSLYRGAPWLALALNLGSPAIF